MSGGPAVARLVDVEAAQRDEPVAFKRDLTPEVTGAPEVEPDEAADQQSEAPVVNQRRAEALARGYTGNSCSECGNFTMVRNGTCEKCETCGATSGCS